MEGLHMKHFYPNEKFKDEAQYLCWSGYYVRIVPEMVPDVEALCQSKWLPTERWLALAKIKRELLVLCNPEDVNEEILQHAARSGMFNIMFWKKTGEHMMQSEEGAKLFLKYFPGMLSADISWKDIHTSALWNYLKFVPANKVQASFYELFSVDYLRCTSLWALEQNPELSGILDKRMGNCLMEYITSNCCIPWKTLRLVAQKIGNRQIYSWGQEPNLSTIILGLLQEGLLTWQAVPRHLQDSTFARKCLENGITDMPEEMKDKLITSREQLARELCALLARVINV